MMTRWWLADDGRPIVWRHIIMHDDRTGIWFTVDGRRVRDVARVAQYRRVFGVVA